MNIKFPINISKVTNITFLRYDMNGNPSRVKDWSLNALGGNSLYVKLEFDAIDNWNGFLFTVDGYI